MGRSLQNSRNSASPQSVYLFREFIRGAVASNMPLDEFRPAILTARGGAVDEPASVYFAISKDTNDTLERVTQVFCGVRMLCAAATRHPLENWTQADYYGLASFFNQVSTRPDGRLSGRAKGEVDPTQPRRGFRQQPSFRQTASPTVSGRREPKLLAECGSARGLCGLVDGPGESVLRPRFGESLLELFLPSRHH